MKKGLDLLVLFFSVVGLIGGICYLFYIKEYWMAVFVGLMGYVADLRSSDVGKSLRHREITGTAT